MTVAFSYAANMQHSYSIAERTISALDKQLYGTVSPVSRYVETRLGTMDDDTLLKYLLKIKTISFCMDNLADMTYNSSYNYEDFLYAS